MSTQVPVLSGHGLCVEADDVRILDQVDIELHPGEVLGLIGPNGAGKTTLLRALAGVSAADQGSVRIAGVDIAGLSRRQRAQQVAYLPQNAQVSWPLSVASVVALGRLPHGSNFGGLSEGDRKAIAQALQRTETQDLADRSVGTLSGGERMRALVARMLAVQADVLLADEPVAALDPYYQLEFMDLFAEEATLGRGVVLVLHDLALAARYCHRVVLLNAGEKVADGPPGEVLSRATLGRVYRIDAMTGMYEGDNFVLPWRRRHDDANV